MKGTLSEPRLFNLMFKTFMGPVEDAAAVVYLRPETAQGIYVNFLNVQQATRQKVPFGIAQIGKAFRNEITPGNFTFRTREFEQMEMQFFVDPAEPDQQRTSDRTHMQWFEYWRAQRIEWHKSLGLAPDRLQFHKQTQEELAHYARAAVDIQFDFGGSLGFQEIEGVHHRGDYDLGRHQQFSGKKLEYFDQPTNRRFIPFIIETSAGADRTTLAVLVNAYREETVEGEEEGRTVLKLSPALAPVKAGIFPLVKKDGMPEYAERLATELRQRFPVFYDESGAIGRRYRRQDEIGTPFCITVDGQTMTDNTVTIRDRDTLQQERVASDRVRDIIAGRVAG
jgi:glycyl-tRNA synthetase